jgi:hypothetical protein
MDTVKDIAALQVGFFLCGDGCQRNALVRLHFFLPHEHLITPQRDFLLLQAEKFAQLFAVDLDIRRQIGRFFAHSSSRIGVL